jgi:hypothetical protein
MSAKDVVGRFGGQTALAKKLGINQSAVSYWVKKGSIPSKWHTALLELAASSSIELTAAEFIEAPGPESKFSIEIQDIRESDTDIDGAQAGGFEADNAVAPTAPFMFYASGDGAVKVQVVLGDETVWASQKGMAEIFDVDVRTVNEHLQNIFKSEELDVSTTIRKFRIVVDNGADYPVNFYSLDAIISVGYRINSLRATQFRRWATSVLKEYLIKGYALDDDRLKQGKNLFGKDYFDDLLEKIREIRASERRFYQKITDIYAQCSVDYDKNAIISHQFYAQVQDKLHFAIHGHTSAELIKLRADATKPHMGLSSYKNEPKGGKVTKLDVTVGKNYLTQEELESMNRLVSMYLDFAENFARRQKLLTMKDWAEKLNDFLEFNAYEVLENFGSTRRDAAERHAIQEYEKFRIVQDREYKSDFDEVIDSIKVKARLPKKSA